MKSRRSASCCQLRPNATRAWRPNVSTSSRKRRHLERRAVDHHRDGAMVDAGRNRLEARGRGAAHHLVRQGGGGDVDVADRLAQQRIAHGAADHARLLAVAVEHVEQPGQRTFAQPGRPLGTDLDAARRTHAKLRPTSSGPARICRPRYAPGYRSSPAAPRSSCASTMKLTITSRKAAINR